MSVEFRFRILRAIKILIDVYLRVYKNIQNCFLSIWKTELERLGKAIKDSENKLTKERDFLVKILDEIEAQIDVYDELIESLGCAFDEIENSIEKILEIV